MARTCSTHRQSGRADKLFAIITDTAPPVGRVLGPVEETVASAIRAVVGEDAGPLGAGTNFFAAGGTSLSAARLAATLAGMGYRAEVADVFENPTVAELAARIAAPRTSPVPSRASLLADDVGIPADLPLTPEQMDVWLRWRTEPEFTGYLLPVAWPIDASPVDARRAVAAIVARHDALCTVFPLREGVPVQHRWDDARVLDHLERELGPDARPRPDVTSVLASMATPIDLATSLPWRVRIVEIDGTTWLLGVIHHIAADGESFAILAGELDTALAGATLPTSGTDYRRYSMWRAETLDARRAELTAFWRDAFNQPLEQLRLPEMNLQAESVAPAGETIVHRVQGRLDSAVTASLDALTVARSTTPFIATHTALAAVLSTQSGAGVVTVGTALSGRLDPGLVGVPGLFARAVPLHTPIDPELSFADLLARVTSVDLGALAHADLPPHRDRRHRRPRSCRCRNPVVRGVLRRGAGCDRRMGGNRVPARRRGVGRPGYTALRHRRLDVPARRCTPRDDVLHRRGRHRGPPESAVRPRRRHPATRRAGPRRAGSHPDEPGGRRGDQPGVRTGDLRRAVHLIRRRNLA
ncbi:condensation domain-containing protein [Gordonia alkanivorans]|uniref:condensation domain-containing protein n=1 Tax=Gordonia alkanivorans TaxID=84096 RepID=UPI001FC9EDCE|nr:condensation domain-containing protein [Gordonia alkanivorans]